MEEKEAEIKKELETLEKKKKRKRAGNRKGRIMLIINTAIKALF